MAKAQIQETSSEPQYSLDEYEVDDIYENNDSGDAGGGPVRHKRTTFTVKRPAVASPQSSSPGRQNKSYQHAGRTARLPDYFLWSLAAVFLFAFTSLFVQLPGLFGDHGVLPARQVIEATNRQGGTLFERLRRTPSLLLVMHEYHIRLETAMTLLCVTGMLVASLCLISRGARHHFTYAYMWLAYMSLYQVGRTFLWFQWDILLLEAGLIAILISPFPFLNLDKWNWATSDIRMWPVRWLLFRLMFSSGIVKLTSQCPTWWDLTALDYHYESQCIPTAGAWYMHNQPSWFTKLSLVFAMVAECVAPLAFFVRVAPIRWLSFAVQVMLQLGIIATGNYNFFNLLTIVLCLSLLGESDVGVEREPAPLPLVSDGQRRRDALRVPKFFLAVGVLAGIAAATYALFEFRLGAVAGAKAPFDASWKITPELLAKYLPRIWTFSVLVAAASYVWTVITSLSRALSGINFVSVFSTLSVLLLSLGAFGLFSVSLLPYSSIVVDQHHQVSSNVLSHEYRQFLLPYYQHAQQYHMVNSYGLFRRMTGVGGRPELIVEGAYDELGPWSPYEFQYKPGNISRVPPFLIPHQPRLDWQMWFAALGSYQQNPWLINLVYRLLQGEPSVYALLGRSTVNDQFAARPPKFVRISKLLYHFTSNNVTDKHYSKTDWWWRQPKGGYLEPLALNSTELVGFVAKQGLKRFETEGEKDKSVLPVLDRAAQSLQHLASNTRAEYVILALFIGSVSLMLMLGRRRSY